MSFNAVILAAIIVGGLAHQIMLLVQLSIEKYPASSSIPTVNFSAFSKGIECMTLICDYF